MRLPALSMLRGGKRDYKDESYVRGRCRRPKPLLRLHRQELRRVELVIGDFLRREAHRDEALLQEIQPGAELNRARLVEVQLDSH